MAAIRQQHASRVQLHLTKTIASAVALSFVVAMMIASAPIAVADEAVTSEEGRISRGGRLYDKWFAVIGAEKPTETHALWPATNTNKSGDTTWRCKSCHGWDYQGKDGAYGGGSYQTGIGGIRSFDGADTTAIVAVLKNGMHALDGLMDDGDFEDLALFVSKGQIDLDTYVDRATKAPIGDASKGQALYETVCTNCHGAEGTKVKDMDPLGDLMGNPWEIMHKIRFGQPDEAMPSLYVFDPQVAADIMSYTATLPKER
jgi:cytochrome c553